MVRVPGSLTVTIVKNPPATTVRRLPTDPAPAAPTLIVKKNCHVEVQRQTEDVSLATINTEVVWIFFPPDSDTLNITATDVLRFGNRDYRMQGPAAVEYALDGDPVVVWCIAEWEAS